MITKSSILALLGVWLCLAATAQAPVADFTSTQASGCSPLVVSFTDASTGNPTTWLWSFGNGATSTLQNPSTTYFIPGTYAVSLTATNASGFNTVVKQTFVTVFAKPLALFAGSDSAGCFPFPVRFTDLSVASSGTTNTAWIWDFGDGTQATTQNPLNTYTATGNYTVSLKVTNDKGCFSTFTKPAYIQINGGVNADFNLMVAPICRTPISVSFGNTSTGPGVLSYVWSFGDGAVSAQQNPTHTYTAPGNYTVSLVTISANGCRDTVRKDNLLTLANTTTAFTAPDSVCVNEVAPILNTSSAAASSTVWSFGDGTTAFTTNTTKTYTTPGTYTIKLRQTYGNCTDSASKSIRVFSRPTVSISAPKTGFCQVPATVNFVTTSSGAASHQWDFGDGTTSTQQSPAHTYTSWGTFTARLTVTNDAGCTDTASLIITIAKPQISFNGLPTEACLPYTHNFSATVFSPDPVASYAWDFGDGSTGSGATPSHTYTTQGSYTVQLTITTAGGCTVTESLSSAITVGTKPQVSFTAVPREVCAFKPVTFINNSTGGTDYVWFFGDGGTASTQSPTYTYSDTGKFTVTLFVKNSGCRDSLVIKDYIIVKPPIAKFIYANTCTDKLNFTFTNQSIGATTYLWNFGDGTTSTLRNPTHHFTTYGNYLVKLVVTNDTCSHEQEQLIRIVNGTPNFVGLPQSVCRGSVVLFTADTTNSANITSYRWNFGHGGTQGSGRIDSTVYNRPGVYNVSLTVIDITGCVDSVVKPQYIRITGPTAAFTASNINGCRGFTSNFTDASYGDGVSNIISWQWNLGDGTIINQAPPAPIQHPYNTAGSFTVSLKVVDAAGCMDSLVRPSFVNASDIRAAFVSADTVSCPGGAVMFTNQSFTTSSYTSVWSFGNGTTSTGQNPTTNYGADGLYSVKLVIKDAFGCTDSVRRTDYIRIASPQASFTVSDSASSCAPFLVRFTNTSTFYTDYWWDLAGGNSTLPNPTQYYNQPGTYLTKLVVKSIGGCTDTATQTITVNDVSNASLSYLPLSGCKPLTVNLQAVAPSNMSYVWDFGDGTILRSQDTATQHIYNFFGDFVPKLILTDASGCVIPVTGPDTIRIKGATAKFGLDQRLLCDSGLVRFSDSTTFNNPLSTYSWSFGDGATSSLASPTHYYSSPGIYPVSLNVLTQNQCVDTFRLSVPVKVARSPDVRIEGDSVICVGEGMTHLGEFNRTDTSSARVRWAWNFPNGSTAAVRLPQRQVYMNAGNFVVQTVAVNTDGCADTARKNIRVNPLPRVELPSVITTRTGTSVQLPATYFGGVVSWSWTHPESLSCTDCPQPVASPKFNTDYKVSFVDGNGCRNTGEVKVIVFCNNDNVFVPNTFSPNGDGSNDVFYVRGKGLNRVKSLRIFNRWGQLVFEKQNFGVNDAAAGWDGRYKGAAPVADVYVYQMEVWCDNSTVVSFDGNVALIK